MGDVVSCDVAPDVVDGDEGHPQAVGHRLGEGHPHQQRPDEAGGIGHRHRVDVLFRHACLPQGLVRQAHDSLHMFARGDLGHDAAVDGVHVRRRGDDRGQHGPSVLDHCGGSLITGTFKG